MNENENTKICPLRAAICYGDSCAWYMQGCRRSCRRWKAYQLTLKIIKERAKKHRYLDPMPDSRTNEVKNRTKKYKGFSQ